MISINQLLLTTALIMGCAMPASAQDARLRAAGVGAPDPATVKAAAQFYNKALGLQETRRIERPNDPEFLEIIMNFGATPEAAKMAKTPSIVLITAPKGTIFPHPTSNLIFEVADAKAVTARAVAAGGKVQRAPAPPSSPTSTAALIGFVLDPAGNRVELIEPKK